jgi:hypothetical protein
LGGLPLGRARGGEAREETPGALPQKGRLTDETTLRLGLKGPGETRGRGGAEGRRPGEGEELENVQEILRTGWGGKTKTAGGQGGMHHKERGLNETAPGEAGRNLPRAVRVCEGRPSPRGGDEGRGQIRAVRIHPCSAGDGPVLVQWRHGPF